MCCTVLSIVNPLLKKSYATRLYDPFPFCLVFDLHSNSKKNCVQWWIFLRNCAKCSMFYYFFRSNFYLLYTIYIKVKLNRLCIFSVFFLFKIQRISDEKTVYINFLNKNINGGITKHMQHLNRKKTSDLTHCYSTTDCAFSTKKIPSCPYTPKPSPFQTKYSTIYSYWLITWAFFKYTTLSLDTPNIWLPNGLHFDHIV